MSTSDVNLVRAEAPPRRRAFPPLTLSQVAMTWWVALGIVVAANFLALAGAAYLINPRDNKPVAKDTSKQATPQNTPAVSTTDKPSITEKQIASPPPASSPPPVSPTANSRYPTPPIAPLPTTTARRLGTESGKPSSDPVPAEPSKLEGGRAIVVVIATVELANRPLRLLDELKSIQRNFGEQLRGKSILLATRDRPELLVWDDLDQPPQDSRQFFDQEPPEDIFQRVVEAAGSRAATSDGDWPIPLFIVWHSDQDPDRAVWTSPPATDERHGIFLFWSGAFADSQQTQNFARWLGSEQQVMAREDASSEWKELFNYVERWCSD